MDGRTDGDLVNGLYSVYGTQSKNQKKYDREEMRENNMVDWNLMLYFC